MNSILAQHQIAQDQIAICIRASRGKIGPALAWRKLQFGDAKLAWVARIQIDVGVFDHQIVRFIPDDQGHIGQSRAFGKYRR